MTAPGPDAELDELARISLGIEQPETHEPGTVEPKPITPVRPPLDPPR